jgi:PAS domain S-box-containing protein
LLVVALDREGRIVRFNRACQQLTGYTPDEAMGRPVWDFLLVPEEVDAFRAAFDKLRAGEFPGQFQNQWVTKDGRRRLVAWSNGAAVAADGSMDCVIGTGVEITALRDAEGRAEQGEATIRALLESAAHAILAVDSVGRIVLCNAATVAMFGYSWPELLELTLEDLIPRRLRHQHARYRADYFAHPYSRPMGTGLELAGLRKDGTEFPVEIGLSHVGTREKPLAVAFIGDITERRAAEHALRRSEQDARQAENKLRELTLGLLAAQEQERRRVSRELHDDLIQKMALLASDLGALEEDLPGPAGAARQMLQSLAARLNALGDDVRRTAYQLHPAVLEHLGLLAALESYCADFSSHQAVRVAFRRRNVPVSIPDDISLGLYRVTQECLRNVARHSGASRASVTIEGIENSIRLLIADKGKGFDPALAAGKNGLGLVSMEERVRGMNGKLLIESRLGGGTRVEVRVPLAGGAA